MVIKKSPGHVEGSDDLTWAVTFFLPSDPSSASQLITTCESLPPFEFICFSRKGLSPGSIPKLLWQCRALWEQLQCYTPSPGMPQQWITWSMRVPVSLTMLNHNSDRDGVENTKWAIVWEMHLPSYIESLIKYVFKITKSPHHIHQLTPSTSSCCYSL